MYIYEIQQGKMRWNRAKSRQKIYIHTSTCGAAIPMLADACLTKRVELGLQRSKLTEPYIEVPIINSMIREQIY
jgi:hypothetical protein